MVYKNDVSKKYYTIFVSHDSTLNNLQTLGGEYKKTYDGVIDARKGIQSNTALMNAIHDIKSILSITPAQMNAQFCGASNGYYNMSSKQIVDYVDYTYGLGYAYEILGREINREIAQTKNADDPKRIELQDLFQKAQYVSDLYMLMANIGYIAKTKRMMLVVKAEHDTFKCKSFEELRDVCIARLSEWQAVLGDQNVPLGNQNIPENV